MVASCAFAGGTIEGKVELPAKTGGEGRLRLRYAGQTGAKKEADAPLASPAVVFVEDVPGTWPAPAEAPKVVQKGLAFLPRVLAVVVGTTVEFPNEDTLQHNVFSYSATKRFDLGRYRTGESRPVAFDKPGLVRVYCEIHAHMKGFILVLKNPFHALAAEDGSYRIEGLPPGAYKLTAWQEEHEPVVVDVVAQEGGATHQDFRLAEAGRPPCVPAGPPAAGTPPERTCCADDIAPPAMEIMPLPGTGR